MEDSSKDPIGSVAEEAVKLIHALTNHRMDDTGDAPTESEAEHHHDHPTTCQWCPVCRLINVIRDNPEAVENVTASAAAFAQSVKSLLDAATNPRERDQP